MTFRASRSRLAGRLGAERLQPAEPHLRSGDGRAVDARAARCWPIRRSRRALSAASISAARCRRIRARRCSTAPSATETVGAEAAIEKYVALAREFGLDPAHMALAFVNSRPFLTSTIIGATTMAQLDACIGSIDVAIWPELETRINAIHQQHCNPCP